jgi:hypothetical protein
MAEYTRQRGRRAARAAQQQQEEQEQLRLDQEHEQKMRREQEFQFQPELLTHEELLTGLTNEKLFSEKELFMDEKLLVAGNDKVLCEQGRLGSENLLFVHELRTHEELLFDQGLLTHNEKLFTEPGTLTNEDPLSPEPAETGTAAQRCPPTSEEEKGKGVPRDESAGGAPHVGSRGGPSAHNEEEDPPTSPCTAPAQTTHHHHLAEDLETNTSFDKSEEDLTAEEGYQPVAPHRRRSFRRAHSHSPSHGGGGARQLGVLLNSSTATLDSTASSGGGGQHMSERMNMFREQPPADKAEKQRSTGGEIFRAALERLSFRRSSKKKKDKKAKSDAAIVTPPTKAANGDAGSYVSGGGSGGVQELRSVLAGDPAVSKELVGPSSPVKDSGIIDSNSSGAIRTPETETSQPPSSPPRRIPSHNKPPLPPTRSRRAAPVSAQWEQSRPLNQLDAALQQFKRSAAQSRENLALSRPDIALIQVRGNSHKLRVN